MLYMTFRTVKRQGVTSYTRVGRAYKNLSNAIDLANKFKNSHVEEYPGRKLIYFKL